MLNDKEIIYNMPLNNWLNHTPDGDHHFRIGRYSQIGYVVLGFSWKEAILADYMVSPSSERADNSWRFWEGRLVDMENVSELRGLLLENQKLFLKLYTEDKRKIEDAFAVSGTPIQDVDFPLPHLAEGEADVGILQSRKTKILYPEKKDPYRFSRRKNRFRM